jgi:hypothetical protein
MRRLLVAAAVGLAVLVPAGSPVASAAATTSVPVIVCPTSNGASGVPSPVGPSVRVPRSAAHLVLYSSTSGYIQILGPKGLSCRADIGMDSTATIIASLSGDGRAIGHGGVEAVGYPSCVGCILSLACPFFPAALKALHDDYKGVSCGSQPVGQTVRRLSTEVVAFWDPAGEYVSSHSESFVPSNSPYPTNGVAVYETHHFKGYSYPIAMEAICVLPATERALCTAVLDEFLSIQVGKFS